MYQTDNVMTHREKIYQRKVNNRVLLCSDNFTRVSSNDISLLSECISFCNISFCRKSLFLSIGNGEGVGCTEIYKYE